MRSRPGVLLALVLASACVQGESRSKLTVPGGHAERGRELIAAFGCGGCHVIPGVEGAGSWVAPPLTHWAERKYIAGALRNLPENLVSWIRDPQAIEPGTAMPTMAISEQQARDMAAYLYTIGDRQRLGPPHLFSVDVLRGIGHWSQPKPLIGSRERTRN